MRFHPRGAHSDLWRGLIQLHVLHHASEEDVYGLGLIEELSRHGYSIGPGTLYPLLHRLTERGYLRERAAGDGRQRRYYATAKGRRASPRLTTTSRSSSQKCVGLEIVDECFGVALHCKTADRTDLPLDESLAELHPGHHAKRQTALDIGRNACARRRDWRERAEVRAHPSGPDPEVIIVLFL